VGLGRFEGPWQRPTGARDWRGPPRNLRRAAGSRGSRRSASS
jgi:hypothetical protein